MKHLSWIACLLALQTNLCRAEDVVTRGPYLQTLLSDSVEIIWHTSRESHGAVRYRRGSEPFALLREDKPALAHRVKVEGLSADSVYDYDILEYDVVLTEGRGYQFRTAPPVGEGTFRCVALGDSGTAGQEQLSLARVIAGLEPDIVLHTGDMDYIRVSNRRYAFCAATWNPMVRSSSPTSLA